MEILNSVNSHGLAASAVAYALGLACANIPAIIHMVITSRIISSWIKKNPEIAESIADSLKKEVDAEAKTPAGQPAA